MKKLLLSMLTVSAFVLSGCGGDNGELAGSFKGEVTEGGIYAGEYDTADLTFDKDKNEYHLTWVTHSPKSPSQPGITGYLTREEGWLISPDGTKYFKITDVDTLELHGNKNNTYNRIK